MKKTVIVLAAIIGILLFCGTALADSWICGNCGTENTGNFCANCGASASKTCPRCGSPVKADAAFCPNCGKKL